MSSLELVQEIHQLLMDREDCCHRTCFSLQLDSVTMDNFAELKSIEGLQDGSVIKVVEGVVNFCEWAFVKGGGIRSIDSFTRAEVHSRPPEMALSLIAEGVLIVRDWFCFKSG